MTTKGPSNRYGNSNGGRQGSANSRINYAWAKDFISSTLDDHFNRHGKQVETNTKESYVAHAVSFANTVNKKDVVSFVDVNGSTYKYNKKTEELAIITKDGYVVTYFKPTNGYKYYKEAKLENDKKEKKK